jgi:hypothetical protein
VSSHFQNKAKDFLRFNLSLENQLLIHCAITPWYKYIVEFEPSISSRTTRFTMINHLSKYLGGLQKLYDGQFLYVPHQLSKEVKKSLLFFF